MAEFHFLRPWWLLGLLPAIGVVAWLWQHRQQGGRWAEVVDAELMPWMVEGRTGTGIRIALLLLLAGWFLALTAIAGPVWKKLPQPVHQQVDSLAIVLDLSLSMYAEDIKPSRIQRARHKMRDLLAARPEGQTALVVYAGDAFAVTPFTDDTRTIENQLQALDPAIMPALGSRPIRGVEQAADLIRNAGLSQSRILLITDGISYEQASELANWSERENRSIDVLGVGTAEGSPIPLPGGGFLKDLDGRIVIAKLDETELKRVADRSGGRYEAMRVDDGDLKRILAASPFKVAENTRETEREFDAWSEEGPWLILLLIPLAAAAFRRGWLFSVMFCILLPIPEPAQAGWWESLWKNPDQRGQESFEQQEYDQAAEQFRDPEWEASSKFRAGDYQEAAKIWEQRDTTRAHYNRGNALAKAGELDAAIAAYDEAIRRDPEHQDALKNRALLEKLKQQQEQQQQQDQEQNSENQDGESEDSGQDGSKQDQQSGEPEQSKPDSQAEDADQPESEPETGEREQQAEDEPREEDRRPPPAGSGEEADQGEEADNAEPVSPEPDEMDEESRQALEQWLRRVPDDPSALLRRKFQYQHRERQAAGRKPAKDDEPVW